MIRAILIFISIGQVAFGQQNLSLTKRQMYADFDTLVKTIYQTSPQIQVKKDVLNYDFIKETAVLRKRIDTISNDLSFYTLLLSVLNSSQDYHTSTIDQDGGWAEKQDSEYWKWRNSKFRFSLPIAYANGEYLTTIPFVINNDTIPIGASVQKFNGQLIDDYIKTNCWARNGFSYDFNNKKFFIENFCKNLESIFRDSVEVSFVLPQEEVKEFSLSTLYAPKYLSTKKYIDSTRVEFWENEKILYIRLTEMNPKYKDYLKLKINEAKSKVSKIDKIIIDIRNNPGGNDNVWMDLYADLLDTSIAFDIKLAVTEQVSKKKEFLSKRKENNEDILKKYKFYNIADKAETLKPSSTSIHFKGEIFVLSENVYSSAGSAVSVASANKSDNLISVGRYTGQFLGIGVPPINFELTHSKLKYRIAPSIEITNVKELKDLMQDKIEILVPFDIGYFKAKFESELLPTGKDFLLKFDPFIKTVMDQ
jgi:hypothetical protein